MESNLRAWELKTENEQDTGSLSQIGMLALSLYVAATFLAARLYVASGNPVPQSFFQLVGSALMILSTFIVSTKSRLVSFSQVIVSGLSVTVFSASFGSFGALQQTSEEIAGLTLIVLSFVSALNLYCRWRLWTQEPAVSLKNLRFISFMLASVVIFWLVKYELVPSHTQAFYFQFFFFAPATYVLVNLSRAAEVESKMKRKFLSGHVKQAQVAFFAALTGIGLCVTHMLQTLTGVLSEAGSAVCMSVFGILAFLLFWRDSMRSRRGLVGIQRQVIAELKNVSGHWRMLLEQMPDSFFVLDFDFRLLFLNEAATNMFFPREQTPRYQGEKMEALFPGFSCSDFAKNYARVFARKETVTFDANWGKGADARSYRCVAYLSGQNISVCVREVTEERRMESAILEREARVIEKSKELARSNEDLQHFAYVVSHDLREPLRTITSFGGLLSRHAGHILTGDSAHYLEEITSGAQRMRQLIDDLLSYSRIQESPEARQREVCLSELLGGVRKNLHAALMESGANLAIQGRLPTLFGDPAQISQLFQNLLANALKFARPNILPSIEISSETAPCGAPLIRVRDNGIGIKPEHLGRIFAVFQRLHTREEYKGTGIGLAICKRIVQRAGGDIWAESDGDHGTCLCFIWRDSREKKLSEPSIENFSKTERAPGLFGPGSVLTERVEAL